MNELFKGTEGKWELHHRIGDKEENKYSVTSGNGKVAYCYDMSISDYENKIAKANAMLISKAPEMLGLLIKINDFIDENENINYKIRLLSREVPNIKQVLKEALGEKIKTDKGSTKDEFST